MDFEEGDLDEVRKCTVVIKGMTCMSCVNNIQVRSIREGTSKPTLGGPKGKKNH